MHYNGRVVWIWCWLGVLVAGCGQSTLPNPTPQTAPATLLSLTRPPDTPMPTLRVLRTPTLHSTSVVAITLAPTPLPLSVGSPQCYEMATGGLWCLGLVRNSLTMPIEGVIIRVYLVTADGTALVARETHPARTILEPGESSPYGILFDSVPQDSVGPVSALINAVEAPDLTSRYVTLPIQDLHSNFQSSIYHVTGTLMNQNATPIRGLTVTITLLDSAGRVTGFRQWRWPPDQTLATGASLPFAIDVIPQGRGTIRVETYANGQPG